MSLITIWRGSDVPWLNHPLAAVASPSTVHCCAFKKCHGSIIRRWARTSVILRQGFGECHGFFHHWSPWLQQMSWLHHPLATAVPSAVGCRNFSLHPPLPGLWRMSCLHHQKVIAATLAIHHHGFDGWHCSIIEWSSKWNIIDIDRIYTCVFFSEPVLNAASPQVLDTNDKLTDGKCTGIEL